MGLPFRVSVVGSGACGPETEAQAERLGGLIASHGWLLVCGGRLGVQRAAYKGAKDRGGATLGILPGLDPAEANEFVDYPVITGLGQMRNFLVVKNGDVAVAVEGGAGTLSEIGLALKSDVPVIALGRWSGLEGVIPAASPEEAVERVLELQARNKRI